LSLSRLLPTFLKTAGLLMRNPRERRNQTSVPKFTRDRSPNPHDIRQINCPHYLEGGQARRDLDLHVYGAGFDALEGDRADALDHELAPDCYLGV
jgi:hypothetical protein